MSPTPLKGRVKKAAAREQSWCFVQGMGATAEGLSRPWWGGWCQNSLIPFLCMGSDPHVRCWHNPEPCTGFKHPNAGFWPECGISNGSVHFLAEWTWCPRRHSLGVTLSFPWPLHRGLSLPWRGQAPTAGVSSLLPCCQLCLA